MIVLASKPWGIMEAGVDAMQDGLTMRIDLPADADGYVELECPHCGARFGLSSEDFESDEVVAVRCPACGVAADSFVPDEVIELAQDMLLNQIQGTIYDEFKRLEQKTKGKAVQFKAGRRPKKEYEGDLVSGFDPFLVAYCSDCGRGVKIPSLLVMSSFVCPCCGKGQFAVPDDKTSLRVALYEFHSEASALMRADYNGLGSAVERFILFIERNPSIKPFLDECVSLHLPEDFDAAEEVAEVSKGHALFGPFPPDYESEVAEVYLILKELLRSNRFRSYGFLQCYAGSSKSLNDKTSAFLDKVAYRLVDGLGRHLSLEGIKMGLHTQVQQTNIFTNVERASAVIAQDDAVVRVDQSSGIGADELGRILDAVLAAREGLSADDAERAADLVEGIRQEMDLARPKKGVVDVLLSSLKGLNGGVQFASAVATLVTLLLLCSMVDSANRRFI